MNQTISGPQFAGLFWRDAFDFFVASDKVTAICVANLMGDEGDIVVGKKQHVFCRIDSGCRNIFFAGHIVAAVKIHGKWYIHRPGFESVS